MSDRPQPTIETLRAREIKRLRTLSKALAALLLASVLHIVIDGASAGVVAVTLVTAVLLTTSVWLRGQLRGSERP